MDSASRRRWLGSTSATLGALATSAAARALGAPTAPTATPAAALSARTTGRIRRLCTFGDSVLDCGRYDDRGLDPGRLLVRNDVESRQRGHAACSPFDGKLMCFRSDSRGDTA